MATLFRPTYTARLADGTKERRQSKTWYAKWVRDGRLYQKSLETRNKAAAQRKLADLQKNIDAGRVDGTEEQGAESSLADLVAEWEKVLASKGGTAKNTLAKVSQVSRVIRAAKIAAVKDLTADKVSVALASLRKLPRFGVQTSNHHLTSCKQFANWLVDRDIVAKNPLSKIRPGKVATDRRHERRDLTDEELRRLFESARSGEVVRGISGPDREMLYLVTVYTGLRASEVASLTPESFRLDDTPPVVVVDASYSKRRRQDRQPIHPDLLTVIRPWLGTRPAGERLWPGRWAADGDGALFLRTDLKRANIDYRVDGRVADFHALRHTFVTRLVRSGASPKDAQTLARHSTITLTMDRYAHVEREASAKALGMVPGIGG